MTKNLGLSHLVVAATLLFATLFATQTLALELVMVETKGCIYCERWDEDIAPIYPKTDLGEAAPLRRLDKSDVKSTIALASPVIFTPTFLFVDEGKEVGRLEGYISEDFFWGLSEAFVADYQDNL